MIKAVLVSQKALASGAAALTLCNHALQPGVRILSDQSDSTIVQDVLVQDARARAIGIIYVTKEPPIYFAAIGAGEPRPFSDTRQLLVFLSHESDKEPSAGVPVHRTTQTYVLDSGDSDVVEQAQFTLARCAPSRLH